MRRRIISILSKDSNILRFRRRIISISNDSNILRRFRRIILGLKEKNYINIQGFKYAEV